MYDCKDTVKFSFFTVILTKCGVVDFLPHVNLLNLPMQKVRAKKALGQHFLTDLSIAQRIADTLVDFTDYPVLEVGPGMGVVA